MDAEEKTAHELRRLQSSVRDLQNALRLAARMEAPVRPPKHAFAALAEPSASPYSHILANNDRGVLRGIERLQEIGVAVVGLNGIGTLAAEAFTRYGVASLVLVDSIEITPADLSFMQFQEQDVGKRKDEQLARTLRRLNPDVNVRASGVALDRTQDIMRALRKAATRARRSTSHWGDSDSDSSGDSEHSSELDSSADDDVDEAGEDDRGDDNLKAGNQSRDDTPCRPASVYTARLLHVVLLCVQSGELASALNELCCELGVLFVYVFVDSNGISGEVVAVAPGRSSCLQCFEKRKIFKSAPTARATDSECAAPTTTAAAALSHGGSAASSQLLSLPPRSQQLQYRLRACLPSTECILSGLAVQNTLMQLLGFGAFCSRVEYDGLLDETDRSGFLPPVHQCPSTLCRLQQHHQQQTAAAASK